MDDFGIIEMLELQKTLQEKYKDIWESISPEIGKNKLLWMIGEIGEVLFQHYFILLVNVFGADSCRTNGSV